MPEKFSLLLPVYHRDRPDFLAAAFRSTVDEQTRRPDQVVLVRDGPVGPELDAQLAELEATSPVPVDVVRLERNVGLAAALNAGIERCRHDVVARMDADDLSFPHRFAVQLPVVEAGVDLVGAGLVEFDADPDVVLRHRIPPTDPAQIRRRARFADPFNHPTVVFRRDLVRAVGGYPDVEMEDYLLWVMLIDAGARVANLAEPLVRYRVGDGAYGRRGGWGQLRAEVVLQRRFRQLGFTSRAMFVGNLVLRGGYRLLPERLRRPAYRTVFARNRA